MTARQSPRHLPHKLVPRVDSTQSPLTTRHLCPVRTQGKVWDVKQARRPEVTRKRPTQDPRGRGSLLTYLLT